MNDTDRVTVLIVDDEPINVHSLAHLLGDKYTLKIAVTGAEAIRIVGSNTPPDIILLDWVMPEMDGLEVLYRIRTIEMEHQPYVIMLTSRNESNDIISGLELGADDYLTKPYAPYALRARVAAAERIVRLQKKLATQARTDVLTGLLNRLGILTTFERELARCRRDPSLAVSIVLIDVDHFKKVNDNFGHQAGDDVLRELANRCQSSIRSYDIIGRYGGEEFLAIFPSTNRGLEIGERLRNEVAATPFSTRAGALNITISLGVAIADGTWHSDDILAAADRALFQAKERGRNQSCLFQQLSPSPRRTNFPSETPSNEFMQLNSKDRAPSTPDIAPVDDNRKLRLLIVDDEPINIHALANLVENDYLTQVALNGEDALAILESKRPPDLMLLDWMMPRMDGLEVLHRIRLKQFAHPPYIIMLTTRDGKTDIVTALNAGADDYLTKPYDPTELHARVDVAKRLIIARHALAAKVIELQQALNEIKNLRGIIPICSFCKKVRNDRGYWDRVETYIREHSNAEFSHSVCPSCLRTHYPDIHNTVINEAEKQNTIPSST